MVPGRPVQARKSTKTVDSPRAHLPTEKVSLQPDNSAKWVSPIDANKGRRFKEDHHGLLVANLPNSCLDAELNSSVISLDFGLVSPRRNWSSPPQRIERAENREWSPHRIIDRPNPENSPGNWVSVKESCQQSLAPVEKSICCYPDNKKLKACHFLPRFPFRDSWCKESYHPAKFPC
ncbi:hypothetical protein RUM44_009896 [Polyplax serrata]|uniref:Uncharacterized protein n=1 Tax=Polyplax serrata TaxID=468196 RepID=A0ABR1ATZ6_POLSC